MAKMRTFFDQYSDGVVIICSTIAGIVLSIFFVFNRSGELTHREALSILSSTDISNGHLTLMRPGSASTGAIEQYLGSPFALIFGSSPIVAIAPRVILFVATCVILWVAFGRTPHAKDMRFVASALCVTALCGLFYAHTFGGSTMTLLTCFVSCLACAYYAAHSLRNVRFFYLFAFLAGLSLWASILSLLFIVPTTIWILYSSRNLRPKFLIGFGIFLFGSAPWWIFNSMNGFISLRSRALDDTLPTQRVDAFDLGRITGLSPSLSRAWENTNAAGVLRVLSIGACTFLALSAIWATWKVIKQKRELSRFEYLIFAITAIAVIIYDILWMFDFHTVLVANVVVGTCFIFACAFHAKVLHKLVILACCTFLTAMYFVTASNAEITKHNQRREVARALIQHNVATAYAPSRIAYPVGVESDDKIALSPFDVNIFDEKRRDEVENSTDAFVVSANSREHTWFMLCVQSFSKTPFERIQLPDNDIYLVEEKDSTRVHRFVKRCYSSAREFTLAR